MDYRMPWLKVLYSTEKNNNKIEIVLLLYEIYIWK